MKSKFQLVKKAGVVVAVAASSVPAFAALSTEEQAVLDSITAKVTDYTGPALAVLTAVIGLWITIKWIKKVSTKVS